MKATRRACALTVLVGGLLLLPAGRAFAHPLGNFTVNTYSGLVVSDDRVSVEFLVDMAEIPTLQRKADVDADGDGTTTSTERENYARQECSQLMAHLDVRVDDRPVDLGLDSSDVAFPAGQAGLSTLRLNCRVSAPTGRFHGERRVSFASANFTNRAGWREITATGDGTTVVASDVPARSLSDRLTRYPQDLLSSPLDQRAATLVVEPGGPAARVADPSTPLPRRVDAATRAFTSFVSRQQLSLDFALVAVLGSLVLGAIHAFAPGHGKTVMAAYLVGQRGSYRQAMVMAMSVTVTHTVGVLALGIAISASAIVAPERLYPWLGAATGVLLALLGAGFLRRVIRLGRGRHVAAPAGHSHGPGGHVHSHGGHTHSHGPVDDGQLMTRRGMLAIGFVGGLLPSPSAVVVLLGAIALGRAWFGVLLVLMYGLGMAATLAGTGLVLVRARGALDRRLGRLRQNRLLTLSSRLVPPAAALTVIAVGLYLTAQGAARI